MADSVAAKLDSGNFNRAQWELRFIGGDGV